MFLTIKADVSDVSQQLLAIYVAHAGAKAWISRAEVPMHAMQRVGHGVHRVHHKLHLPLLLVSGVPANLLQACNKRRHESNAKLSNVKIWPISNFLISFFFFCKHGQMTGLVQLLSSWTAIGERHSFICKFKFFSKDFQCNFFFPKHAKLIHTMPQCLMMNSCRALR